MFWSRKAKEMFGYDKDEVEGKAAHELIAPSKYANSYGKGMEKFMKTGEGNIIDKTVQLEALKKGGTTFPVELTLSSLQIDEETRAVAIVRNITERIESRAKLEQTKNELETILSSAPVMIWYKDTQNNLLRVNKAAAELSGIDPEDIEGKSTREVYPDQAEAYYRDDREVMETGEPKLGIIEPLKTANGEQRWVQTHKAPYRDEEGDVTGIIVLSVDITERKEANEALNKHSSSSPPLTTHNRL